jgi:hypothetical protein
MKEGVMKKAYVIASVIIIAATMTATLPAQQPPAPATPPQQPQGPDMNAYYMLGPDSQSQPSNL